MFFQDKSWRRVSQQIIKTLKAIPNLQGSRVVVALSGGIDSAFLLFALSQLGKKYKWELFPVYVHHNLIPENDLYEKIALISAKKIGKTGVSFRIEKSCPRNVNLEEWLRNERYGFLEAYRKKIGANYIAVAHHALDQAETMLAHIIRGTGIRGLRGIIPFRGKIIRPIIAVAKKDIEELMLSTDLPYYNDKLNYSLGYQRNRIRHQLIPYLEKNYNPRITLRLAKLADIIQKNEKPF